MESIKLTFEKGQGDSVDPQDVKPGFAYSLSGFECRRGYARSEFGRGAALGAAVGLSTLAPSALLDWTRRSGTLARMEHNSPVLYSCSSGYDFATVVNTISVGATTATRSSLVVTIAGGHCVNTAAVGDYFYWNTDTLAQFSVVASVDSDTQLTLTAYNGTGATTSGAFTLVRPLAETNKLNLVPVHDDRVFVGGGGTASTINLYWYGDNGAGTDLFRPAGMKKPTARPTPAAAAGGSLSAGKYRWYVAFKDARGVIGPAIETIELTASLNNKCTLSSMPAFPAYAQEYMVYRPIVNCTTAYSIAPLIETRLASIAAYVGGSDHTVLTVATDATDLTVDQHICRRLKFATSGNVYTIKDNDATTITVDGDADAEVATDWITIEGGYDCHKAAAAGVVDLTADTGLDVTNECPGTLTNEDRSFNEPPPTGLKFVTLFRGGGRLAGVTGRNKVWFSGRPFIAPITGNPDWGGNGEYDYWPIYREVGNSSDEVMGLVDLGGELYAICRKGVWILDRGGSDDCINWQWARVPGADGIECLGTKSITTWNGLAFWFGTSGGEYDVIQFDGSYATSLGRKTLGAILDTIIATTSYHSYFTATVHERRLYLSFVPTGQTANTKTLRYDFDTGAWDVQPWGCGVFAVNSADDTLMCGAPTATGYIHRPAYDAHDLAADIARELITGDIEASVEGDEGTFSHVVLEVRIE